MKIFILSIILILVLSAGAFLISNSKKQETIQTSTANPTISMEPTITDTKEFNLSDIANHSTKTDCWMAIEDNVYDVTKYIASNSHPGGNDILDGCGKDATALFNKRPEDNRPHSFRAKAMLSDFQIGSLKK